jgi:hypothetical protein
MLISTMYKSLQHSLSLFSAFCILTSRFLTTAPNSEDSSSFRSQVPLSQRPMQNCCHFPPDNCQLFPRLNWIAISSKPLLQSSAAHRTSKLSLSPILRPTVSRPVCLGIKHPSAAYDQIFITVRQLPVCSRGALSLTRGRNCRLQLLLALTSSVLFGSDSCGTHDHILLPQIRDFPFRSLLRLAGLWWRYPTRPPHRSLTVLTDLRSTKYFL